MRSSEKKQGLIRIKTPAKITPFLRVGARRADGYHEVGIVLAPVSLFDELVFTPDPGQGIGLTVAATDPLGGIEDNLVYLAAKAFQEKTGVELGVRIHLTKGVPAGAGLGGGSANAAGTLVVLNAMAAQPLLPAKLFQLALGLGSDVPFFLEPRPAYATGRGEQLSFLTGFPPLLLLVVKPPFSISTGRAYDLVASHPGKLGAPDYRHLEEVLTGLENDFEPPLLAPFPELGRIKEALLAYGAGGALLSGTGSAVFGIFRTQQDREQAHRRLAGHDSWQVYGCEVLPEFRYLG